MNISLIIYGTLDNLSGGYLYDRMVVDYLRSRGARIDILSLPWRNYAKHLMDNFSSNLPRILGERIPDLLLQDELNHPSLSFLNRRLRKTMNCPIISIVHHLRSSESRPAWQNGFYRWVEKRYLETADGFIFNSKTTRLVVNGLLEKEGRSIVAYPGKDHLKSDISEQMIVERCLQPGPLKILFTGNVIPRKGLHTLIHALARLPRQSWKLTVAGSLFADARYAERIKRLISREGLEDRIKLLDTVPQENLVGLLKSHHCLAVPSFYEGFGIVYLEAMGFGQPVIASTAGAVPEVVQDGREGFLISPGDTTALAGYISRLINDRDLLLNMSLAARKRYLEHPTWAESAEHVYDFLDEMIRIKKQPGIHRA
jgi:glycosyltransferase involved in cell wall biosynthesis